MFASPLSSYSSGRVNTVDVYFDFSPVLLDVQISPLKKTLGVQILTSTNYSRDWFYYSVGERILLPRVIVADPDLVGSGLFGSAGSGFFIHKKTPLMLIFRYIKSSKRQFRQNYVLFQFSWNFKTKRSEEDLNKIEINI